MPSPSTPNDYPVELERPDIRPYAAGNCGLPYVHSFDSGAPGPHVLVSALVHGNELCGAIALDWLLRQQVRPVRGRLTLAFMNVEAYHRFDAADPNASRFVDEDFNRVWDTPVLDGPRHSAELRRAREVRPLVDTVDLLLDIHSMQHPAIPLMMAGPLPKGRALAREVGTPATVISDKGHAAGRRMRDYGRFADPQAPHNALLVECGQHWAAPSAGLAVDCALRFLRVTGAVAPDFAATMAREPLPPTQCYEVTDAVTIQADAFRFAQPFRGGEILPREGTLIGHDGDRPVTTPYDDCMLVMPSKRLYKGQTAVRLARRVD